MKKIRKTTQNNTEDAWNELQFRVCAHQKTARILFTTTDPPLSGSTKRLAVRCASSRICRAESFFFFPFFFTFTRLWLEIKMLPILCWILNFILFPCYGNGSFDEKFPHKIAAEEKTMETFFVLQRVCCILQA